MDIEIPAQKQGGSSDTVSTIVFKSDAEARHHFEKVKKRFLDINSWELFAGKEKAEFSLRNNTGELLLEKPEIGNHVKIKIPGLKNPTDDVFDWVIIEDIVEAKKPNCESVYIRVRPTSDPTKPEEKTAHFFDEKATSNFIIKREKNTVSAEVHGRNEEPNLEDLSAVEKVRNFLVAVGGMIAGSKFQWKSLTDGLIRNDEK